MVMGREMTLDELRAKYLVGYKIVERERRARERVFPPGHKLRDEKLREMDRLMEVLKDMKDELKQRMTDYEQPTLLDVPRKTDYR